MGDSEPVQVCQAFSEASHDRLCLFQRQSPLGVDVLEKSSSFQPLKDQVEGLFCFEYAFELDHILVLECPQQLDFLSQSFPAFLPLSQIPLEDHFGCEELLIAPPADLVDTGCAPLAQFAKGFELLAEPHLIDEAGELLHPDVGQAGKGQKDVKVLALSVVESKSLQLPLPSISIFSSESFEGESFLQTQSMRESPLRRILRRNQEQIIFQNDFILSLPTASTPEKRRYRDETRLQLALPETAGRQEELGDRLFAFVPHPHYILQSKMKPQPLQAKQSVPIQLQADRVAGVAWSLGGASGFRGKRIGQELLTSKVQEEGELFLRFIRERVKERRIFLPLLSCRPCNFPITSRLSERLPNSTRHIHLSFPFCFHSIQYTGQSRASHSWRTSGSQAGVVMVMQRISEGGLQLGGRETPSLLYSNSSSLLSSFLRTRVSQCEQKTLKLGLAQLIQSLAWMAFRSVSNYTSALLFSLMKMTLPTFPKLLKMLQMQSWSKASGNDRAKSTLEGQFSSRNCSELGLTMVLDFLRLISELSSQLRNSSLSRAISRNCSSMSMKLLKELLSLDFLAERLSDLYLAEVELWSQSFSRKEQQLSARGSCAQKGAMQSWKVLLRLRLELSGSRAGGPSCCCLRDSQFTPPRLSLWNWTCLSLERKMFILLPSSKMTLLSRCSSAFSLSSTCEYSINVFQTLAFSKMRILTMDPQGQNSWQRQSCVMMLPNWLQMQTSRTGLSETELLRLRINNIFILRHSTPHSRPSHQTKNPIHPSAISYNYITLQIWLIQMGIGEVPAMSVTQILI